MTPVVIAFTVFNRPELLKRTLEGWSKVRGIGDAVLEFYCEPGCDESVELCQAAGSFAAVRVHVNRQRLGHGRNTLHSMNHAFLFTDYAITAVDDFLPSADLLELHQWFRESYGGDDEVLGLTSGRDIPAPYGGLAGVWRCKLVGILSGFHRHKWEMLAGRWDEHPPFGNWWVWVNQRWLQGGPQMWQMFPALSRAEDMGDAHPSSCFQPDPAPQAYHEVKGREFARGFQRWWEDG